MREQTKKLKEYLDKIGNPSISSNSENIALEVEEKGFAEYLSEIKSHANNDNDPLRSIRSFFSQAVHLAILGFVTEELLPQKDEQLDLVKKKLSKWTEIIKPSLKN